MPKLTKYFSSEAVDLLEAKGLEVVKRIGIEAVREVVIDVMSGRNLRDSTEVLTRTRIANLNLAIVEFFLKGLAEDPQFVEKLPFYATENLKGSKLSKAERWLNFWALGLTEKGYQNILRDKSERLEDYRDEYIETFQEVIGDRLEEGGGLTGHLEISSKLKAEISWGFFLSMMSMAGSQTLAIRGSDKSLNGKLFEKLILGSLLHSLDFRYSRTDQPDVLENTYWLSSRGERRESDATLLLAPGQAVRFDIGFIGRGNPEISLDKVTRFEREIALAGKHYYVTTIIIVDRIGRNSRIGRLAERVEGNIVQMSASYWIRRVADILNDVFDYQHPLRDMSDSEIKNYLEIKLKSAPLEEFIGLTDED